MGVSGRGGERMTVKDMSEFFTLIRVVVTWVIFVKIHLTVHLKGGILL